MKLLLFSNDAKKFKPKYRFPVMALVFGCLIGSFVPSILFSCWLTGILHIDPKLPVNSQDNGDLWCVLFLGFFVVSISISYVFSFVLLACGLRWFRHWSVPSIRNLIFESQIPPHWYK